MILQWIATNVDGQELLITYWESDEHIEVAPRLDRTRWGPPLEVVEIEPENPRE